MKLEQPDPAPRRRFALYYRDEPCTEHATRYTGAIPCTGVLRCDVCGTEWCPDTGRLIRTPRRDEP